MLPLSNMQPDNKGLLPLSIIQHDFRFLMYNRLQGLAPSIKNIVRLQGGSIPVSNNQPDHCGLLPLLNIQSSYMGLFPS